MMLTDSNTTNQSSSLNYSANWKVTAFEEDEISISIDFDNPKGISNKEVYNNSRINILQEFDELSIDFNGRYFFVSEDMTKVMPSDYQIKTQIPP